METIEEQVRKAVANDFANRARDVFRANDGNIAAARDAVCEFFDDQLEMLVETGDADEIAADELREEFEDNMIEDFSAEILTEKIEDLWGDDANSYANDFFEAKFGAVFSFRDLPEDYDAQYEIVIGYVQRRDNIVNALVKKAEEAGIQAITPESIRAAVRAEFKTAEDYVESQKAFLDTVLELNCSLMDTSNGDDEAALLEGLMQRTTRFMYEKSAAFEQAVVKADVEAIYKQ